MLGRRVEGCGEIIPTSLQAPEQAILELRRCVVVSLRDGERRDRKREEERKGQKETGGREGGREEGIYTLVFFIV